MISRVFVILRKKRIVTEHLRQSNKQKLKTRVILKHIELQSGNHYHREELPLTQSSWQQFLEVKQRGEDEHDLVDGILLPCVGKAENRNRTRFAGALCELMSRLGMEGRRVPAHSVASAKMRSIRECA